MSRTFLIQAWWRYIIAGHNGVKKEHQAQLFYDLRVVADAMSFEELESRLQHLKQSPAWKSNPKVRYWLESHWLNCMPAWVAGYRTGKAFAHRLLRPNSCRSLK